MPLVVPPRRPPDEIFARDWLVSFGCRDDSGRPLAEGRLAEECRVGVPLVLKSCPFEGSRFHHERPMNQSALKQLGQHWQEMRHFTSYMRHAHMRRYPRETFSVPDVLWFASSLVNIQNYLMRRVHQPLADGEFPSIVGTLYKTATGVTAASFIKCVSMWLDDADEAAPADPVSLHQFVEEHRLLIGAREVCAGPPELIQQSLRHMALGDGPVAQGPPALWALIEDWDAYLEYATAMMKAELLKQACAIQHFALLAELTQALRALPDPAAAALADGVDAWAATDGDRSWYSAQSSGGVINRYFGARAAGERARVLAGMARLVARLERAGTSGIPPAVFSAATHPAPEIVREHATSWLRRALPHLSPTTVAVIADFLSRQTTVEALALEGFHALGGEFARARGADTQPLYDESAITWAIGETVRQHFCARFSIDLSPHTPMVTL